MRSLLNETGAACVSLLVVMSAWHGEAAGRKLVWSDEFDGTELDRSKWGYETGFVRNREYQYYTDRRENVRVENGRLVIEGRREDFPNAAYDPAAPTNEWQRCRKIAAYTSGSINTLGKFGFRYGRIECRAKVPQGAGTWPAFWMMGTDFAEVSWPKCGEIDVLEYLGKDPDRVTCNLHGWSPEKAKNQSGYLCGGMSKLDGVSPTDGFHVYAAEWDEKGVTMFYDDRPYGRYSFDAYDRKDGGNCFRKPHFILLNLALGAEWMMPMDQMTRDFPLRFEIDWIRVYDKQDGRQGCVTDGTGYSSWPMIQSISNRLVCVYSRGTKHSITEGVRGAFVRTSDDFGMTWSEERTLANDPVDCEVPIGKGLDGNGAALFWVRCYSAKSRRHDLYRTADGVGFERIASPVLDPMPMQITDVFKVPDGLMCLWFAGNYSTNRVNSWGTLLSADNGKTWVQTTVERDLPCGDWPTEPSAVCLGDGRVLVVARTEWAVTGQFQIISRDWGRTWSRTRTNILDVMASTPSLILDSKRGLVYNYYYDRKNGLLRRRVARAEDVFDRPFSWPDSEILARGSDAPWESGNANATVCGDDHFIAYYSGRIPVTDVYVHRTPTEGWKPLPLWGGGYMQDVIISPSEPNVWYCHADVCGPFRSDDAGRSWKPLHQNFPAAWRNTKVDHVRGLLVDPRDANRVLVAGGDNWNFTGGGIVVSDDGGRTWRMTLKGAHFYGNGPRRMYGRVLSRDPFNPDRIVAGEDRDGLWLSRDNGETWKNLGLTNHWFTCVAFDTAKEGRIWATSFAFAKKNPEFVRDTGFYRSDDFGETWTRLPCEPPANEFAQLTKGGPILAIFENRFPRFSSDGGQTWTDAFEGLEILSSPPKKPWQHGNFYALGAGKDFYLLGDGGGRIWRRGEHETTWAEHRMTSRAVGDPPCEQWVAERTRHQEAMSQFVIDPQDGTHWLTTDWFAIWETKDAGRSFVSRVKGISEVVPFCLAFDPNSAENIAYGLADQGLFISNDGGKSYYPPISRPGTPERRCEIVTYCGNSLAYSTRTPGVLYVTGGKAEPLFRVSADAGRTWKAPALNGLPAGMRNGGIAPYAVSVHPVTDDVWITMGGPVGRGKGGIYRSSDRGENWTWAGDGLPEGAKLFKNTEFGHGGGAEIFFSADGSAAVAHARVAGKVFWHDGTSGIWHAAEGLPENSRNKLVADNFTPGRFLIAGSPARESTDGGRTWHPLKGLEKIGMTYGLAADAATPGLFAAVGYDAIYVSRDGAKTFALLPGAFETVPSSLGRTVYLDRGRLYFLTTGTGVWVRGLK